MFDSDDGFVQQLVEWVVMCVTLHGLEALVNQKYVLFLVQINIMLYFVA